MQVDRADIRQRHGGLWYVQGSPAATRNRIGRWSIHLPAISWEANCRPDLTLMSSFFAQAQFQQFYGEPSPSSESGWTIPARWQTGLQNGVQVGSIIGLAVGGQLSDKIGYRWTMITSVCLSPGSDRSRVQIEDDHIGSQTNELLDDGPCRFHLLARLCTEHRDAFGWSDPMRVSVVSLAHHAACR